MFGKQIIIIWNSWKLPSHVGMKTNCVLFGRFLHVSPALQDLCRCLPTISNRPPQGAKNWKTSWELENLAFSKGYIPLEGQSYWDPNLRCWDLLGLDIYCRDVGDDGASALATNLPRGEDLAQKDASWMFVAGGKNTFSRTGMSISLPPWLALLRSETLNVEGCRLWLSLNGGVELRLWVFGHWPVPCQRDYGQET